MAGVQGYRLFNVQLARKTEISPSLLSLVFSGQEVAQMKSDSPDQRIKMLFPSEDGTPPPGLRNTLIVADKTALPAAHGILERLAAQANPPRVQTFFEVPEAGDCVDLSHIVIHILWPFFEQHA